MPKGDWQGGTDALASRPQAILQNELGSKIHVQAKFDHSANHDFIDPMKIGSQSVGPICDSVDVPNVQDVQDVLNRQALGDLEVLPHAEIEHVDVGKPYFPLRSSFHSHRTLVETERAS